MSIEHHVNESRAVQHHQALMREGSTERMLKAIRDEVRQQAERQPEPAAATAERMRARRVWRALITRLAASVGLPVHTP